MKALASGVALLGVFVAVGSESPNAGVGVIESGWRSPTAVSSEALTAVVRQYCWVCHNDALLTGNLSLEGFDVDAAYERAETAERMVSKLRAGMMPPPNAPRPAADTLQALVETLERVVDGAAAADPNPGNRRFQRLNQAEYERVIEDLLGLEIDAGNWLPSDTYLGSFDNLSAAQGLSTTLLEAYLRAAAEISRLAVGNSGAQPSTTTYKQALEASQHAWDHIEGAPYGTRGGVVATHDFPVDGEYVFTVETFLGRGTASEDVDISIDGEGVALLAIEHNGVSSVPIRTEPTFVRGGQRRVSASFIKKVEGPYEDRLSPHEWSLAGGTDSDNWANYGITVLPHLRHMQISGPINPAGVSETASRKKVFRCRPATPIEERSCAESIISRLGSQAFRRPLTSEEMAGLVSFYESGGEEGGFEVGVRTALEAILASPSFVFRFEKAPAGVQTGQTYLLNNLDLASRLSFFLWGRLPDEELVEFASQGKLTLPGGIEQQVERMLADPRSEALATRFASQWLRLQDLEKIQPDPYLYPDYSRQLASAMRRETELFFYDIVRHDRSILDLFTADYTYVNERLARYYGIPSWGSTEFQRVQQPDEHRRGVLGQSSILVLTSLPDRTSPVLRGKWVMEVLLGTPPPPPAPERADAGGNRRDRGRGVPNDPSAHGEASGQPRVQRLPPVHGSHRPGPRQLRRRRPVADPGKGEAARHARHFLRRDADQHAVRPPRSAAQAPDPAPEDVHRQPARLRDREARGVLRSADHQADREGGGRQRLPDLELYHGRGHERRISDEEVRASRCRRGGRRGELIKKGHRTMEFITGRHIPRRTFLRGVGASVALPFLDSMVPAGRFFGSRRAAAKPTRLVCIEESMGMAGGNDWGASQHLFAPAQVGRDFQLLPESQLKPLEEFREYLTIVSQTDCRMAEPYRPSEIGGDHHRSTAVFLTHSHPKQTQGSDLYVGTSLDQLHAQRFGQDTALPSLELMVEDVNRGGGCNYNYHCAYTDSISWASPSQPLPAIREPRAVFERLFGAGDSAEDRAARRRTSRSVIDWIAEDVARLRRSLDTVDRLAMDQYLEQIREIERRILIVEERNSSGEEREMPEAPTGVPDSWEEHMKLMFDLQLLALEADITRVISFKTGLDLSNRAFLDSGVQKSFHAASHHGNQEEAILDFHRINTYRLSVVSHFLDKLKNTRDGETHLLDQTAIIWGSPMGDPNLHNHRRCPLLLMGKANGALEGNLHVQAPEGTPMANALVTLLQRLGHDLESFGDSTGALSLSYPHGAVSQSGE